MVRDLKKLAKKSLVLSELMEGREKIDTEDIIKYYKKGITINNIDINVKTEFGTTVVYTFEEDDSKFAFGGVVIQNLFSDLVAEYEGDIGALKEDLRNEGLKIKLSNGETKEGQPVTLVEVVD